MSFQCRNGWHCQFLELDLKTPLPKKLCFASPGKVVELVELGGGYQTWRAGRRWTRQSRLVGAEFF
jgi:hypothetical protein